MMKAESFILTAANELFPSLHRLVELIQTTQEINKHLDDTINRSTNEEKKLDHYQIALQLLKTANKVTNALCLRLLKFFKHLIKIDAKKLKGYQKNDNGVFNQKLESFVTSYQALSSGMKKIEDTIYETSVFKPRCSSLLEETFTAIENIKTFLKEADEKELSVIQKLYLCPGNLLLFKLTLKVSYV